MVIMHYSTQYLVIGRVLGKLGDDMICAEWSVGTSSVWHRYIWRGVLKETFTLLAIQRFITGIFTP